MKRSFFSLWIAIVSFSIFLNVVNSFAQELHPRLFVTNSKIEKIKKALQDSTTYTYKAFNQMKSRVLNDNLDLYFFSHTFNLSAAIREASLLYQITSDTNYSQLTYKYLQEIMFVPDSASGRPDNDTNALTRAMTGFAFAIGYDWCYSGWNDAQRNWTKNVIIKSLNEWTEFEFPVMGWGSGTNHVWDPYLSNWVAVCQGTQLMMTYAVHLENSQESNVYKGNGGYTLSLTRQSRYNSILSQFTQHLSIAYGNLGVTGEGLAYLGYSGGFLFPAMEMLSQMGVVNINPYKNKEWWKWIMYASSFLPDHSSIQNGVAGNYGIDKFGVGSLLFEHTPSQYLPYYAYFYNRFLGLKSLDTSWNSADGHYAGTTWAVLNYNEDLQEKNPTGIFPKLAADTVKGAFYFRNRWENQNDILFSIMSDSKNERGVHNSPEAFQINLIAYGTKFIGGPGRVYKFENLSALFVDSLPMNPNISKPESVTGSTEFYIPTKSGGYVCVDGGIKYRNLGLDSAFRHCYVQFDSTSNSALFGLFDKTYSSTNHLYSWQINIGDEYSDHGVLIEKGSYLNYQTFTLKSPRSEGYVKGYCLYPSNVIIETGDPLKIKYQGSTTDLYIVMIADSGNQIQNPTITGSGLNSVFTYKNMQISYNSATQKFESLALAEGNKNHYGSKNTLKLNKNITFNKNSISVLLPTHLQGKYNLTLYDLQGKVIYKSNGQFTKQNLITHELTNKISAGSYLASIESDMGRFSVPVNKF